MLNPKPSHCWSISAVLVAALLTGCATPNISPKLHVLKSGAVGLHGPEVVANANWWLSLDDRQLDRIMDEALKGNPSLDNVLARLRLASAGLETQNAGLLPEAAIDAQEQRSRLSGAFTIPPPYAGSDRWVGSIQGSLSWTLDFAGRQRALISLAISSANAAALDAAAARIVLTGAVAQTYVGLARAEQQTEIAEAFVRSREESLLLARTRFIRNLASEFDIRAPETLLAVAEIAGGEVGDHRVDLGHE